VTRQRLGALGALIFCPCHWIGGAVLLGGTAATAWLARHLAGVLVLLGVPFLVSLWLLLRRMSPAECERCVQAGTGRAGAAAAGDVHA
jgi:hypothetical protein